MDSYDEVNITVGEETGLSDDISYEAKSHYTYYVPLTKAMEENGNYCFGNKRWRNKIYTHRLPYMLPKTLPKEGTCFISLNDLLIKLIKWNIFNINRKIHEQT